mmetsp:Transcript_22105/g.51960  ORF Transcript_22105/g.51960 Transcript_22105/m.51960 type:complete len:350 (-) Transcript_22105:1965-3014(-)
MFDSWTCESSSFLFCSSACTCKSLFCICFSASCSASAREAIWETSTNCCSNCFRSSWSCSTFAASMLVLVHLVARAAASSRAACVSARAIRRPELSASAPTCALTSACSNSTSLACISSMLAFSLSVDWTDERSSSVRASSSFATSFCRSALACASCSAAAASAFASVASTRRAAFICVVLCMVAVCTSKVAVAWRAVAMASSAFAVADAACAIASAAFPSAAALAAAAAAASRRAVQTCESASLMSFCCSSIVAVCTSRNLASAALRVSFWPFFVCLRCCFRTTFLVRSICVSARQSESMFERACSSSSFASCRHCTSSFCSEARLSIRFLTPLASSSSFVRSATSSQ